MSNCQLYARHNMPVMGLTMHEMVDFSDYLIKANDMQLEAMKKAIIQEMNKRDKSK